MCAAYSGFVIEGQPARLVTFDIQGSRVDERVVTAENTDPVISGPLAVRLVGALMATTEESTVVVFEIRNRGEVRLDVPMYLSEYAGPNGDGSPVRDAIGPSQLAPGVATTAVVVFERARFGGTLTVEATTDEDRYEATIRVPER